jgi:hypothetical protein
MMHADQFETRLAIVRHRFATTLESKIKDVFAAADRMSRDDDSVLSQISQSYRSLHGICGIGPTVGFAATADAAGAAEGALVEAYRESRGLTQGEALNLKSSLLRLQDAASTELRLMYQRGS